MKFVDVGVQVGYFRKGRVVKGKKGPPLCEEVRSIKSLILLYLSALGEKREGRRRRTLQTSFFHDHEIVTQNWISTRACHHSPLSSPPGPSEAKFWTHLRVSQFGESQYKTTVFRDCAGMYLKGAQLFQTTTVWIALSISNSLIVITYVCQRNKFLHIHGWVGFEWMEW